MPQLLAKIWISLGFIIIPNKLNLAVELGYTYHLGILGKLDHTWKYWNFDRCSFLRSDEFSSLPLCFSFLAAVLWQWKMWFRVKVLVIGVVCSLSHSKDPFFLTITILFLFRSQYAQLWVWIVNHSSSD